jgi:hypothetical protein
VGLDWLVLYQTHLQKDFFKNVYKNPRKSKNFRKENLENQENLENIKEIIIICQSLSKL